MPFLLAAFLALPIKTCFLIERLMVKHSNFNIVFGWFQVCFWMEFFDMSNDSISKFRLPGAICAICLQAVPSSWSMVASCLGRAVVLQASQDERTNLLLR